MNAIEVRRELHRNPEIGFDLPKTLALLRRELSESGIQFTETYGKSSIVATINPEKEGFTLGIRADMDALPITEENDVPYRSQTDGAMHACGHDVHTAIALEAAKRLNAIKNELSCRVKILFQSAEEFSTSGARLMAEDGVMDDIDAILALHCDATFDASAVAVSEGAQNAMSDGFRLIFEGKSAHVSSRQNGVDAIAMAVRAYSSMEMMISKEFPANEPRILNVGAIHGGVTNNVVCDKCTMFGTLRTNRGDVAERAIGRIRTICEAEARASGGKFTYETVKHYPIVYNDEAVVRAFRAVAVGMLGEENVQKNRRQMDGEDFSYLTEKKPGAMFRLGVANRQKGITSGIHTSTFDVDEGAVEVGVGLFVAFVKAYQNGIPDLPREGHRA